MTWTDAQRDEVLLLGVGMTWGEIAAEHDMRCGCRPGSMFRLVDVDIIRTFMPPSETVTLELLCDHCGERFAMPLHAKEQ